MLEEKKTHTHNPNARGTSGTTSWHQATMHGGAKSLEVFLRCFDYQALDARSEGDLRQQLEKSTYRPHSKINAMQMATAHMPSRLSKSNNMQLQRCMVDD